VESVKGFMLVLHHIPQELWLRKDVISAKRKSVASEMPDLKPSGQTSLFEDVQIAQNRREW